MADARNYKQYRREVLDRLGVQYYDEDIEEFDRWRLKVLQGLKDLYGEENIINAINAWLDEHTINFDGATASEEGEAGLVPPTTLGTYKRQARAHYHLNAEGDWVVDPVWEAYGSGYEGTEKIKIKYPNSTGTAGVNIEAIGTGQKGVANGVATLDAQGYVPETQIRNPSADMVSFESPNQHYIQSIDFLPDKNLEAVIDTIDVFISNMTYVPKPTTADNGKVLTVVNGAYSKTAPLTKKVLKTLTSEEYNHSRGVTVYYDGDVLPEVRLYNEEPNPNPNTLRWIYEAQQVYVYTTNDHPEYGEHKALFWFVNRASSNLTTLKANSKMICETNANYAEGGNIVH